MQENLYIYQKKRNFNKTKEPKGKIKKTNKKLSFVVQHHIAKKEHYDLRLEYKGILLSWAIPKGPSYNVKDKRLAVHVENHPIDYKNFEGIIPKNEYGGGTVMIFDIGTYIQDNNFKKGLKEGKLKFTLKGKRLKGKWTLIRFKDDNWFLLKEKDEFLEFNNIKTINTSIKTGRTLEEIIKNINKKKNKINIIEGIDISNPDKKISNKIKKIDVINYYKLVSKRMLPFIKNRIISSVRCPKGLSGETFFKKHLEQEKEGLVKIQLKNKKNKLEDYYYITNIKGLITEAQMNTIEFHTWGSRIESLEQPDIMVFDLDPDEKLSLKKLREGVKNLKETLDELRLKSYLKTSGGKGYHIVVPIKNATWKELREISKNIAILMENKWPDKYTSNMRINKRNKKIFIDWIRNTRSATSIAPYSLRARKNLTISMPIAWNELDNIKPNGITIKNVNELIKKENPWKDFFK